MKLLQRWAVLALFLVAVAAIMAFLPRSLEESIGDGFQVANIPRVEVSLGENTVVWEKEDEAFGELIKILNSTEYSRTFTKKSDPTMDDHLLIRFANGDEWRWQLIYQGGECVELGPQWSMKTCSVEEVDAFSEELLTFLAAEGLS